MKEVKGEIWDTKGLAFLGYWALKKHQFGHGLLILHATALGVKVGSILHLKWKDFKVEEYEEQRKGGIYIETSNKEKLMIDWYLIDVCNGVFNQIKKYHPNITREDFIYTNSLTGKVLTTSTLKRELQSLYKKTKEDIEELIGRILTYRNIETNVFEIAWAREVVKHYRYLKPAFIKVSKKMGHRTLKDTIMLLECDIVEEIELTYEYFDKTQFGWNAHHFDDEIKIRDLENTVGGVKHILTDKQKELYGITW